MIFLTFSSFPLNKYRCLGRHIWGHLWCQWAFDKAAGKNRRFETRSYPIFLIISDKLSGISYHLWQIIISVSAICDKLSNFLPDGWMLIIEETRIQTWSKRTVLWKRVLKKITKQGCKISYGFHVISDKLSNYLIDFVLKNCPKIRVQSGLGGIRSPWRDLFQSSGDSNLFANFIFKKVVITLRTKRFWLARNRYEK